MDDRLITLAIHTYEKALILKSLLESEGIQVTLQNVNLVQPVISSGVRLRIHESDLPQALRIVESSDVFCAAEAALPPTSSSRDMVLVPVDDTEHSFKALKIGMQLAARHAAGVILLHAYISPVSRLTAPMSDALTFGTDPAENKDSQMAFNKGKRVMATVEKRLQEMIAAGEVPPVKFTARLEEGVAEDVITAVARQEHPLFIVMGTRATGRKERDMVGSVTAEVLDTCRTTVITVPEESELPQKDQPIHTLYFGNMDQADMLALDTLAKVFINIPLHVTLVPIPSRPSGSGDVDSLLLYCRKHYPSFTFDTTEPIELEHDLRRSTERELIKNLTKLTAEVKPQLIALPNKRRNVFARFFNPTLPHRLLYDAALPMAVIPV